jgi:hypothetical protein
MVNGTSTILTCPKSTGHVSLSKVREKLKTTQAITLAFLFTAIALFSSLSTSAQTNTTEVPAKDGSYQFIFRTPGSEQTIALTPIQLIAIERLRKDNEAVYVASSTNDYIKIKILPRSVVNSGKQLPKIIFKSEMEYEELQSIRYVEIP